MNQSGHIGRLESYIPYYSELTPLALEPVHNSCTFVVIPVLVEDAME